MQRVVVRTVTTLVAKNGGADTLLFCAMAVKNLTVLNTVKASLDDQVAGIAMDILSKLGHDSNDTIVLCAATLFNCLPVKQSRFLATDKNIVAESRRLMRVCSANAQHSCTVLLAELSKYSDVTNRLLDGGIMQVFSSNLSSSDPRSGKIYSVVTNEICIDSTCTLDLP